MASNGDPGVLMNSNSKNNVTFILILFLLSIFSGFLVDSAMGGGASRNSAGALALMVGTGLVPFVPSATVFCIWRFLARESITPFYFSGIIFFVLNAFMLIGT